MADPDLLGGQPVVKGTRLSVSHILACLAEGMTAEEIAKDYPVFPVAALSEVLKFAAEQVEKFRFANDRSKRITELHKKVIKKHGATFKRLAK